MENRGRSAELGDSTCACSPNPWGRPGFLVGHHVVGCFRQNSPCSSQVGITSMPQAVHRLNREADAARCACTL